MAMHLVDLVDAAGVVEDPLYERHLPGVTCAEMLIFRIRPIDSRHCAKSFSSRALGPTPLTSPTKPTPPRPPARERRNGVAREKTVVADLLRVVDNQALHITLTLTVT
jgi:hypothetical protein